MVVLSYQIPTYKVGRHRLFLGVWKHGVSIYGLQQGRYAGFTARHPPAQDEQGDHPAAARRRRRHRRRRAPRPSPRRPRRLIMQDQRSTTLDDPRQGDERCHGIISIRSACGPRRLTSSPAA